MNHDVRCISGDIYGSQTFKPRPGDWSEKISKIVHLLQTQRAAIPFQFTYHHYGPYAPALQETLDRLVESHMVEEVHTSGGFEYRLTEDGEGFLKRLEQDGYHLAFDEELFPHSSVNLRRFWKC